MNLVSDYTNTYLATITETHLLYFFSALAQCAAGFAALVGVFAIFRLQTNSAAVSERYEEAKYWYCVTVRGGFQNLELPDSIIKERLQGSLGEKNQAPERKSQTERLLNRIKNAEGFEKKMYNAVSKPLKLWAYIFLFSMAITPNLRLYEKSLAGFIAIGIYLLFVVVALWKTKVFIQNWCLKSLDDSSV